MANLALFFKLKRRFICTSEFILFIILRALRMHEVKIKIFHAANGKLTFKKRTYILLGLEEGIRKLVRQNIAVTGIAVNKAFLYRSFALSADV